MKISAHSALVGDSSSVSTTGNAPAMYTPTTGTNWLTTPTHTPNARGKGTPMMLKAIQVAIDEMVARTVRDRMYPPVFWMARSHMPSTRRCRSGRSRAQMVRRSRGPSAVR